MAGKTSTLTVRIVSDAKEAAAGFAQAEGSVGRFSSGLDKASVAAGGVVGALALAGREAYQAASALQQSTGATEAVFGAQADAIKTAAKGAAEAVGLSTNAYQEMATVIGSQLRNMGVATDQVVPKTQGLIKLGADLSAVYGGTAADAVEALSALLRGETDPIERYGVSIKQSSIQTELAAEGHAKLTGTALQAAQAQAVLALLSQQTGTAVGQFAAQAGTAAEASQTASAKFENAKAALGEALLPAVTAVNGELAKLADWAANNSTAVSALALTVGGLATGVLIINGAMAAYRAVAAAAVAVQWLLNIAMDANPIGLIVLGIAALIAIVVTLYNKFAWFRDLVKEVWSWIKKLANILTLGLFDELTKAPSQRKVLDGGPAPAAGAAGGMWGAAAPAGGRMWGAVGGAAGGGLLATPALAVTGGGDTLNITINGAVDAEGTADQLRKMLARRDQQLGRTTAVTLGLKR